LVLALLAATSSRANVLTEDDAHRFRDFKREVVNLNKDILDVVRSTSSSSVQVCLFDVYRDISEVEDLSSPIDDLVALDVAMVDPTDERAVISYLRIEIDRFLSRVAINRNGVNATIDQCALKGAVAAKAQETVRLFDEGTALVEAISKKIGTSPNAPSPRKRTG
jgi:hypothetical protein